MTAPARPSWLVGITAPRWAAVRVEPPVRVNGELMVVRGAVRHWPSTPIHSTSFFLEGGLNAARAALYTLRPGWRRRPCPAWAHGVSIAHLESAGRAEQHSAADTARYVALRHLGHQVPVSGAGALVTELGPGPAAEALRPGDVIVSVSGTTVSLGRDAVNALTAAGPGALVLLEVVRANSDRPGPETVQVRLAGHGPLFGALLRTHRIRYDWPIEVDLPQEAAGGSAGSAVALSVVDVLTAADVAAVSLAATGTIGPDGTIGPVAGIAEKARSLAGTDIRRFLVPPGSGPAARRAAPPGVAVVEVATFVEALAAAQA